MSRSRTSPIRTTEGMTLIEIMIVIVIIALLSGGIGYAMSAATKAELRLACMRVASAANASYGRAVARGQTIRILMNFETNEISLEEAVGTVNLARASDDRRKAAEDESGEEHAAVNPWLAATSRLENVLKPTLGASPFSCLKNSNDECSRTYTPRAVGRGIRFVKLFVPHEPEPRTTGKGAIYFFPMGMTEHAVVQLTDNGERIYSVEIQPLTGAAQVFLEAREPEQMSDENNRENADRDDLEAE